MTHPSHLREPSRLNSMEVGDDKHTDDPSDIWHTGFCILHSDSSSNILKLVQLYSRFAKKMHPKKISMNWCTCVCQGKTITNSHHIACFFFGKKDGPKLKKMRLWTRRISIILKLFRNLTRTLSYVELRSAKSNEQPAVPWPIVKNKWRGKLYSSKKKKIEDAESTLN